MKVPSTKPVYWNDDEKIDMSREAIAFLQDQGYLPRGERHTYSEVKYATQRYEAGKPSDLGLRKLRDLVVTGTRAAGGVVPVTGITMATGGLVGVATALATGASIGAGILIGGGAIPIALVAAGITLAVKKRGVYSDGR